MNDYSSCLFHFLATRKHFFKDVRYNVYVFNDFMVMGEVRLNHSSHIFRDNSIRNQSTESYSVSTYKSSLYKIQTWKNALSWSHLLLSIVIDIKRWSPIMKVFWSILILIQRDRFKEVICNKVTFFKIADFYDPQYIIGKGSSARVLLVQKLYESNKYAVKSIDKAYLFKSENGMVQIEFWINRKPFSLRSRS